jgi:hypothetical protein
MGILHRFHSRSLLRERKLVSQLHQVLVRRNCMPSPRKDEDKYVIGNRKEMTQALLEMIEEFYKELRGMEQRMADKRRNKKRGPSQFWNIRRRMFRGSYTAEFQIVDGVFWDPMRGVTLVKKLCHPQVFQLFRTYYHGRICINEKP